MNAELCIQHLCQDAARAVTCARRSGRHPLFRPITVSTDDRLRKKLHAFSRDISRTGIGLLHRTDLEHQDVRLSIRTMSGRLVDVPSKILWCKPCGAGWYISGARAEGWSARQALTLWCEFLVNELKRRWQRRYPLFRPVAVKLFNRGQETPLAAFTRDISTAGIGLMHCAYLKSQHLTVEIPNDHGTRFEVQVELIWCERYGEDLYLSGGKFSAPKLELMVLEPYRP